LTEHVTALAEATQQAAPEAPAAHRRKHLVEKAAPSCSAWASAAAGVLWDRAVAITGTRLVPSPHDVAVMMYDFSFGGIYDDASARRSSLISGSR
jgi:NitT/TauT family transport system permease protein